ncbi:MAG: VWA domain-containing protein [Gemmataceae bacterium]|nr:VWA domain-containing protein [Gemmataceae bacterium]MCI0741991.1 VWA domain-containing protein [Gemmataceae bacterium]
MTAKIHIERMMHRNSIAVTGESAASYALIKLIPSGLAGAAKPMGLNLALVLDVSGSMYEEDGTGISRLKRIQDAAVNAIQMLKPDDTMSVVAFAHNALMLLPPTPIAEKDKIEDVIRKIDMYDVDPGGTSMNDGMRLALEEVEKAAKPGTLSQVVVLTDGETSGEQDCRQIAQMAADKKIHLTLMGVGLDWKASLIKDLAKISEGKWYYIDVNQASEAERIFVEEFETLAAAAFMNVEMHLRPMKDIRIKRVRQVVPEIKELQVNEPEERHLVASLGTLQKDASTRYVLDLSLPKRADGKYVIAQMEVSYEVGTSPRESTGPIPLEITYTAAGHGYINAEVARHIDEVQIFELNNNLQKAIASENKQEVERVAKEIEKKGELMGPRAAKKTMLAKQVLQELNAGGRVSKKTQLAMEDSARLAEEMPTS